MIDVNPNHLATVTRILARHVPECEVRAFGSRVTWTAKDYSDLDLVVVGERALDLDVLPRLKEAFEESDLPFRVDVLDWHAIRSSFRKVIEKKYEVVQKGKQKRSGMAVEWRERPLAELTDNFDGTRVPVKEADRRPGPYPYYGASGVVDYVDNYLFDGEYLLVAEDGENLRTRKTRVAFLARAKFWVNNHAHIVRGNSEADTRFLMYALSSADISGYLTGSTMPKLTQGSLNRIPLLTPPLPEQRAIAHILGTLDDKIELNRQMNDTLEAMAQALFKSWFVDFDPVRAKAEGRDPGLPKPLADLFPDSFEDSDLGELPKGWAVTPLPGIIDVNPTRPLRKGDVAPYLDMANMPTRGHSPDSVIDRPFGSGMRFMNGDTLVARITPCLENGKTAFVDFLKAGEVGWGSTEYIVLRPKPPLPEEFAYCLARRGEFRDFAIQSMTGSSGRQRVPAESLGHFRLVAAPKPIAELFGRLIKPLFARASGATRESRALSTLRDALLPKLISGELRVRDSERIVGAEDTKRSAI